MSRALARVVTLMTSMQPQTRAILLCADAWTWNTEKSARKADSGGDNICVVCGVLTVNLLNCRVGRVK